MEEEQLIEGEANRDADVAPALIAVHPLEKSVVVAVGSELRIFNLEKVVMDSLQCAALFNRGDCPLTLLDDSGGPVHSDAIRAISFGAGGKLFASAGDDKLVKVWTTDSWHCVRTVCAEKRVSAVAVSHDGLFVTFADKFGLIWVVGLDGDGDSQAVDARKPVPLLGHYCSIITSLKFSPDGQFIASADRDLKIRITVFPRMPLKGAHEIQSFCLGHADFVSCIAFVCPSDYPQGFLISGSGDSTVRLWDFISGSLLGTCEVGSKAGLVESNGTDKDNLPAVIDICTSLDGSLIAVAIQGFHGVMLLNCDFSAGTLFVTKVVRMEESYVPTSLCMSPSSDRLWTVMGASNLPNSDATQWARIRVVSGFREYLLDPRARDVAVLEDSEVPSSEKLLLKLQGSSDVTKEEASLAAITAALKMAMRNLLTKKHYSEEKRNLRKRSRNDRKLKS